MAEFRYIQRDKDGIVLGHYANPQSYTDTEDDGRGNIIPKAYPEDHPDIIAWRQRAENEKLAYEQWKATMGNEALAAKLDAALLRIVELEIQLNSTKG